MSEETYNGWKKRVRIGQWTEEGYGTLAIVLDVGVSADGRLSITGDTRNGMTEVSGGQNRGDLGLVTVFDGGVTEAQAIRLGELWERWHLNDMCAGSKVQENWLRDHPITAVYPESHYDKACKALAVAGLNPDGDGYSYGHEWKREELPESVMAELVELTKEGVTL